MVKPATKGRVSRAEIYARSCVTLSSPPRIYGRLMQTLDDPRAGPGQVATVLSEDQGLTARLLVIVNSAFYALPWRIDSISEAVRIIGTTQIRDLAVATSVLRAFDGVRTDVIDVDSLRQHGLATGIIARVIAHYTGEANTERFFIAGLIHDIGRLVLAEQAGPQLHEAISESRSTGRSLRACEADHLGCSHVQVGGALLDRWSFPSVLRETVRFHHQPQRASAFPVEASVVHIADLIAHSLRWGRSGQPNMPEFDPHAWSVLSLGPETVPGIIADAKRQLESAQMLLSEAPS